MSSVSGATGIKMLRVCGKESCEFVTDGEVFEILQCPWNTLGFVLFYGVKKKFSKN